MNRWLIPLILLVIICNSAFIPAQFPMALPGTLNSGDVAWMLTASGLVLLMTPGISLFYSGMVSNRNIISTMLQSFVCLGIVSIAWVVCGFSLVFGESVGGFVGDPRTYLFFNGVGGEVNQTFAGTIPFLMFALFQMKFAVITPALITGSFAERVRFSSYLLFVVLFSLLIYAPVAHWTWHPQGFLRSWGVIDFAGGLVVHIVAGFAALAGALYLGQRESIRQKQLHLPGNIPFVIIGTGMLWFGWFGFNAGSTFAANDLACRAFLTTTSASAAGMLAWIFFEGAQGEKPTALGACLGAVVGLVAITPAAGNVSVGASLLIGVVASLTSNICVQWKSRSPLDDTLDVFPCHGVGGIVGMMLTAVFADDVGLMYGQYQTLTAHFLSLLIVGSFSFLGSLAIYWITDRIIPLRVTTQEEVQGLDRSQHGEFFGEAETIIKHIEQYLKSQHSEIFKGEKNNGSID
jgi:Amt family ammonium transporter